MSSKETCYLKEQKAASTFFFLHPSLLTFSPSYRPLSMHPTQSICQAASALKQCTNHCTESVAVHLLSGCSPVGLAAASCSGLSRQQPDPRTTVRLPGAKSSNDRPLPLKQSQGHTGTERHGKTRVLTGTEHGGGKKSQFLYFSEVCWRLSIYLSSTIIILFKFNWRRSL